MDWLEKAYAKANEDIHAVSLSDPSVSVGSLERRQIIDKRIRAAHDAEVERVTAEYKARFTAPIVCLCGSTRFMGAWNLAQASHYAVEDCPVN